MPTLGEKLRDLRKTLRLTLDEAAAKADVSKSYLWELENKPTAQPTVAKLSAIAVAYGTTVAALLEEEAPADSLADEAFFRNYRSLEGGDKEQLRQIMETFQRRK